MIWILKQLIFFIIELEASQINLISNNCPAILHIRTFHVISSTMQWPIDIAVTTMRWIRMKVQFMSAKIFHFFLRNKRRIQMTQHHRK